MKNNKNIINNFLLFIISTFFLLPIVFLILASIFDSPFFLKWDKVHFSDFHNIISNTQLKTSLINSLIIGLSSSMIGISFSIFYLINIKFNGEKQNNIHKQILSIPIFFPDILWGLSILFILKIFNLSTGFLPVFIIHIVFNSFLSHLILRNSIINYSYSQIQSAQIFGLSKFEILLYIVIPNIKIQLFGCFLLCFIYSFDDFLITYILSGSSFQTFPIFVYSKLKYGLTQDILAITTVYVLLNIVLFLTLYRFNFKYISNEN